MEVLEGLYNSIVFFKFKNNMFFFNCILHSNKQEADRKILCKEKKINNLYVFIRSVKFMISYNLELWCETFTKHICSYKKNPNRFE